MDQTRNDEAETIDSLDKKMGSVKRKDHLKPYGPSVRSSTRSMKNSVHSSSPYNSPTRLKVHKKLINSIATFPKTTTANTNSTTMKNRLDEINENEYKTNKVELPELNEDV